MPVPPLRDVITPTSTAGGLPAATLNERLLLTLAMLATGTAPDGTTLPGGGARIVLGPLTLTATGVVSGLPTLNGTATVVLGPLTTTAAGTIPAAGPPVAGYTAWYDASQITGLADGAVLTTWADLSGNGNTVTQAGTAGTAVYYSTTSAKLVNGLPTVWQNNSASNLTAATGPAMSQPLTLIAVYASSVHTNAIDGRNTRCIISGGAGNTYGMYAGTAVTGPASDGLVHVEAGVFNGASSFLYVDGTQVLAGNPGANSYSGANPGGGQWAGDTIGPMCEYLFYPFALTAPQIASIHTYLSTKWGTP